MKADKTKGAGASAAFKRYLAGNLSSSDYLRESRREADADVRRELARTQQEKIA